MDIFMLAVALILSVVVAAPSRLQVHRREDAHPLCRGTLLYSQAQCCDLNALGVAGLGCTPMKGNVTTPFEFIGYCAKQGKGASCCTVPIAGLDLLCSEA